MPSEERALPVAVLSFSRTLAALEVSSSTDRRSKMSSSSNVCVCVCERERGEREERREEKREGEGERGEERGERERGGIIAQSLDSLYTTHHTLISLLIV